MALYYRPTVPRDQPVAAHPLVAVVADAQIPLFSTITKTSFLHQLPMVLPHTNAEQAKTLMPYHGAAQYLQPATHARATSLVHTYWKLQIWACGRDPEHQWLIAWGPTEVNPAPSQSKYKVTDYV